MTPIAEHTVDCFTTLVDFAIMTAIAGDVDLSVVGGRCFGDLLFDDIECIHWKPPVVCKFPVPSAEAYLRPVG